MDKKSRSNEGNIESLPPFKVENPDLNEFARICLILQWHHGGSQMNDVLLKEI